MPKPQHVRRYECKGCHAAFSTIGHLVRHRNHCPHDPCNQDGHGNPISITCHLCGHVSHSRGNSYCHLQRCKVKTFYNAPSTEPEARASDLPQSHKCPGCNNTYFTYQALGKHRRYCLKDANNKDSDGNPIHITCTMCGHVSHTRGHAADHLKECTKRAALNNAPSTEPEARANDLPPTHECPGCGAKFPSAHGLARHRRCCLKDANNKDSDGNPIPITCTMCGHVSHTRGHAADHLRGCEAKPKPRPKPKPKVHECPGCSKKYSARQRLLNHRMNCPHDPSNQDGHGNPISICCEHCEHVSHTRGHAADHLRGCTKRAALNNAPSTEPEARANDLPPTHECPGCNATQFTTHALVQHRRYCLKDANNKDSDGNPIPITCTVCGHVSHTRGHAADHLRGCMKRAALNNAPSTEPEARANDLPPTHECPGCNNKFSTRKGLSDHRGNCRHDPSNQDGHGNPISICCEHCGHVSHTRNSASAHRSRCKVKRKKDNVVPQSHDCQGCGAKFPSAPGLSCHRRYCLKDASNKDGHGNQISIHCYNCGLVSHTRGHAADHLESCKGRAAQAEKAEKENDLADPPRSIEHLACSRFDFDAYLRKGYIEFDLDIFDQFNNECTWCVFVASYCSPRSSLLQTMKNAYHFSATRCFSRTKHEILMRPMACDQAIQLIPLFKTSYEDSVKLRNLFRTAFCPANDNQEQVQTDQIVALQLLSAGILSSRVSEQQLAAFAPHRVKEYVRSLCSVTYKYYL